MHPRQNHNSHVYYYRWQMLVLLVCLVMFIVFKADAQSKKKLDLEDLSIKGELLNDGRLNILGRERVSLENYVKFRTNYRQVMVQALPTPAPKRMSTN
ncbi:MAG: hypothetical protein KDD37_06025 [Bdellovibrionales bacterium]|nr:hypothetical protein [Bdellovibrionales bacterium]